MTTEEHSHWEMRRCTRWRCTEPDDGHLISFGLLSGFSGIAAQLMRLLGHDPDAHRDICVELEFALGEGTLEIGEDVLRAHGLAAGREEDGLCVAERLSATAEERAS